MVTHVPGSNWLGSFSVMYENKTKVEMVHSRWYSSLDQREERGRVEVSGKGVKSRLLLLYWDE